jgi:hypothetical protein
VDLLFSPKVLAYAVAPWLAALLAATGFASLAYERFVARPEVLRFSSEGRRVSGTVVAAPVFEDPGRRDGGARNRSIVAVNDSELGSQLISTYGILRNGAEVPTICLTSARHCMSASDVKERIDLWPLTPMMLSGATELALAFLLTIAARRRRIPLSARQPTVPPRPAS